MHIDSDDNSMLGNGSSLTRISSWSTSVKFDDDRTTVYRYDLTGG